jgi:protein arginine kinase activator
MKCELCHKKDATVFVKQVLNGQVKKLHACHECASEQGFDLNLPIPLMKDLLFGVAAAAPPPPRDKSCPVCRMSAAEFRKTSLLGCPACYDAFTDEVAPYLDSLPETASHCGKVPARERLATELAQVRTALEAAVAAQDFETAARLRDSIAGLKSRMGATAPAGLQPCGKGAAGGVA